MPTSKRHYVCQSCGTTHLQWSGRCGSCGEWNTIAETAKSVNGANRGSFGDSKGKGVSIHDSLDLLASQLDREVVSTGSSEFDRALGGGITRGSVTLVGGVPGVGKSTLLTQFLISAARSHLKCLYVSAEESMSQIAARISRLGGRECSVGILIGSEIEEIEEQIVDYVPDIVVIDSIQTVYDSSLTSSSGSVTQVRECAVRLSELAKGRGIALILVGHVTKDGSLAGPRVLEHLVDTVAYFEGDRDGSLRVLRVVKHRYGPVGDLGMFDMSDRGLMDLENATGLHLSDRVKGQPGSVVFPALDGRRVMMAEVQALVVPTAADLPRRVATGVEMNRVLLLLAVLEKKAGIRLSNKDVFLSVAGGIRLSDPAADLALIAAIVSSLTERPVDPSMVLVGEVGLGGEIRSVSNPKQRLAEAVRLGFTMGIIGPTFTTDVPGMSALRVRDVKSALAEASLSIP